MWTHGLGFPVVGETPKGWGAREFVDPRIGVPSGWGFEGWGAREFVDPRIGVPSGWGDPQGLGCPRVCGPKDWGSQWLGCLRVCGPKDWGSQWLGV